MTRKEIFEYLNYQGEYTKEVKKKINRLLKKYHPDKNKKDKKTILLIYEIKKELEKNSLKEETSSPEKNINSDSERDYSVNKSFIERIIKILKKQKQFIENSLKRIYKKEYYWSNKIYKDSYDIGLIDIKVEALKQKQLSLKKMDFIDYTTIIIIIFLILLSLLIKNILIIFLIIFPVLIEIYHYYYRVELYLNNENLLQKLLKLKDNYQIKQVEMQKNLNELKQEEIRLKKEKSSINNDIAFYDHELNKTSVYEKEKSTKKETTYTKK